MAAYWHRFGRSPCESRRFIPVHRNTLAARLVDGELSHLIHLAHGRMAEFKRELKQLLDKIGCLPFHPRIVPWRLKHPVAPENSKSNFAWKTGSRADESPLIFGERDAYRVKYRSPL